MRELPNGAALLELARALLIKEVLPLLPEQRRYDARLIANAIAIAAREAKTGAQDRESHRRGLAALYGEGLRRSDGRPNAETLDEANERLSWRLAAELRGGKRDADPEVFAVLRRAAAARLATVNPKALEGHETDGDSDEVQ